jgi:hypothetical protein
MSSTETTSLGLKAIVVRNATKLNETDIKKNMQQKQAKQN